MRADGEMVSSPRPSAWGAGECRGSAPGAASKSEQVPASRALPSSGKLTLSLSHPPCSLRKTLLPGHQLWSTDSLWPRHKSKAFLPRSPGPEQLAHQAHGPSGRAGPGSQALPGSLATTLGSFRAADSQVGAWQVPYQPCAQVAPPAPEQGPRACAPGPAAASAGDSCPPLPRPGARRSPRLRARQGVRSLRRPSCPPRPASCFE